ncbi:MAG: O-methyltransferase [Parvularculaceae bacterium]
MRPPLYFRRFDYNRALLPNRWLAEQETGVEDVAAASGRTGKTIGYPGWSALYAFLLCHLNPDQDNIIVETGTNVGCSSIILAQALIDAGMKGRVHTIEIDPAIARRAGENFAAAGVDGVITQYVGDAKEKLAEILPGAGKLRAAFLDGSHDEGDVMREFELIEPHLAPGALVFFDNTYQIAERGEDPRVNGALRRIKHRYGGNIINLEFVSWFTPGLAIWQRETFTMGDPASL